MKIAVIFPSRGLAFSQTCEELLENLEGYDYEIYFSHGKKIPDCFNEPLERALKTKATHFWFVEDDMVLPKNTLKRLIGMDLPAVACDYPLSKDGKPAAFRDPDDNAIYVGTGCMLVTRAFLKPYKKPVFKTDIAWDIRIRDTVAVTPRKSSPYQYGLHDITFSLEAYKRGTPIKISNIKCGQRKLVRMGGQSTNQGQHVIEVWGALVPHEPLPTLEEKNRTVLFPDGTEVYMDIKRAKELEKQGKVTIPPLSYVEFV